MGEGAERLLPHDWHGTVARRVSEGVQAQMNFGVLESELHAVERVPAEGRGKPPQFIPIRFLFTNKLSKDDKLLLAHPTPPDLVLNRHCAGCEFQARCKQKAVEKDDLSLWSNMPENERTRLHRKGIFTVTQLSYMFRPRRRPKKLRDKREKYHHSLKALA